MSTQKGLNSPCAQVLFPNGHYSYAFGNTPAVELTEHFGTWRLEDTLNILFLGVGDIRNLLFTVSELCQRSEDAVPERLCCHLNDCDLSVLARDVIILESVCSIDPCSDHDVDFLWNIWYNLALSRADSKRLKQIIQNLTSQEHVKGNVKFGSRILFEECQEIWKDWLHQKLNIEETTFQRRKVMLSALNLVCPDIDSDGEHEKGIFAAAASSLAANTIKQLFTTTDETKLGVKCLQTSGLCYQEVFSYFQTGCTSQIHTDTELNPTLVRPFEHKWKVYYGSCPYDGYIPINRNLFEKFKSIAKSCKEILRLWVTHFQRYSPKITVTFWGGDALELCRVGLPRDLLFDVVDTSNLSDHVGLLNILVCCARRLKKPGESQLITSTMLWRSAGLTSLEEYLKSSLGIQRNTYPTILGLHLAEDLNLGKSDILSIKKNQRIEERFVWVKTALERSPINLVRSPDILDALKSMADRCFNLPCHGSRRLQLCGATLSSPLTFFLAFRHVAEIFQESAEQVLSYVEDTLPKVRLFQKRSRFNICGLSWNVLKRLTGLLKEAIMKIQVAVTFPSFPRITPVLQAVLFEDPADARFLTIWPVSQMKQRIFHRPVHLFYNNILYDPAKGIATLFMLESDWEGLHPDTILLLISSSVSCTSGAVHLKRHCHFREPSGNLRVDWAKNGDDIELRHTLARKSILRSKRRKSNDLARNLSCVRSVSCIVFNQKNKGLQKFDSSYRLDNLPMQDRNTGNSSNVHSSTDCLLSTENIVTHFYKTGISSPCFQLKAGAPLGRDVSDENLEPESDCEAVISAEPLNDNIQSFGSFDLTPMTLQPVKADHFEVFNNQARVFQKVDSIIHWINPYPLDNSIPFDNSYPLDKEDITWTRGDTKFLISC